MFSENNTSINREELLKSVEDTIQNIAYRNHNLRDANTSRLRAEKKVYGAHWGEMEGVKVVPGYMFNQSSEE